VRIFSIVFNEPYLTWFEQGCVRSLLWPRNAEALKAAARWDIWTTPADAERVRAIASRAGLPLNLNANITGGSWSDKEPMKANLLRALLTEMEQCAAEDAAFLWLAPDSIFGDGTIGSIMALGAVPGVSVSLAPMRVNAEGFVDAMGSEPLSNAALVRLSFERAHQAFKDAEATLAYSNSYKSGVSWRRIGAGLYAVTHRKHSSYLTQPTKSDVRWFRDRPKFGNYDHAFPSKLIEEQRQRVIGSSDAAFVAELTTEGSHMAPVQPADPAEPDRYWQDLPNYRANRSVVAIWRAA
jgi:hypothetical protein